MASKTLERQKAISLRKKGFTYTEILRQVPVAKSTLSRWLISVDIAKKQKQRLTKKRQEAVKRGNQAWKSIRIKKTKAIKDSAFLEIGKISERELWLLGIALYWGEGTKEKEGGKSKMVIFSNSDPKMLKIYEMWLEKSLKLDNKRIVYDLFIHQNHKARLDSVIKYWSSQLNLHREDFDHIYFKRHNIKTNRMKTDNKYFGLVRIVVTRSTDLNRRISGWVDGIAAIAE